MYVHRHAKIHDFPIYFAIFTKASPTDRKTAQRTNEPANQWTYLLVEMQKPHLKRKSNENVNALVQKAVVGIIFKEVISK